MAFRPQFAFPEPPAGCEYHRCQYAYDSTNLPALLNTLLSGQQTGRIPLVTDRDAPFLLRAIETIGIQSRGGPAGGHGIMIRLETPSWDPLDDNNNTVQSINFEFLDLFSESLNAVVPVEGGQDGVWCPPGGAFNLYVYNSNAASQAPSFLAVVLHGVKLYRSGQCQ